MNRRRGEEFGGKCARTIPITSSFPGLGIRAFRLVDENSNRIQPIDQRVAKSTVRP
jgi:hypothetical protein